MKRIILFTVLIHFVFTAMAQNIVLTPQMKDSLIKIDDLQRDNAIKNPIVKKVYFSNCQDTYIEQHYYPNGQLYFQVPVVNGKRNGMYIEYYSNGQYHYEIFMKDGYNIYNASFKTNIDYDYFGNIYACAIFKKIGSKTYQYDFWLAYGSLMIYRSSATCPILLAEYKYFHGKWEKSYIHRKPVWNSRWLLQTFMKEWEKYGYTNLMPLSKKVRKPNFKLLKQLLETDTTAIE